MRVALFVPCYVDQMFPDVAMAALEVLERYGAEAGLEIEFPADQSCCGQPLYNAGARGDARELAARHLRVFAGYDAVVSPSGSCVAMVRHHYARLCGADERSAHIAAHTYELCEFLCDVLRVERVEGRFAHRVGLHPSCHSLRTLRLADASERRAPPLDDRVARLLRSMDGLELVEGARADECCGFGGVFAVQEGAVSTAMGRDRIAAQRAAGAQILTSVDASCLAHLEGLIRRDGEPLRVMHVAQILAGREPAAR